MAATDFDNSRSVTGRRWSALLLVCLLGLSYIVIGQNRGAEPGPRFESDYRAPVPNPVLEPDRPDLIGEPRINEP